MLQHMGDAAAAPGKVQIEEGAKQCPTQAWTVSDRRVDVFNRCDPLLHQVKGFLPKGRLQTVSDIPFDFSPDVNGPLADRLIEGERLLDGVRRRRRVLLNASRLRPRDRSQRHQIPWQGTRRPNWRRSLQYRRRRFCLIQVSRASSNIPAAIEGTPVFNWGAPVPGQRCRQPVARATAATISAAASSASAQRAISTHLPGSRSL